MFRSIVVGTDGSEPAGRAVEVAGDLARDHDARLHVVTACSGSMDPGRALLVADGAPTAAAGPTGTTAVETGLEARTHVLYGDPADAIVEAADAVDADLIVVGSKGIGGVQGFLLGSVPTKLAANAPCSVLIVRPR